MNDLEPAEAPKSKHLSKRVRNARFRSAKHQKYRRKGSKSNINQLEKMVQKRDSLKMVRGRSRTLSKHKVLQNSLNASKRSLEELKKSKDMLRKESSRLMQKIRMNQRVTCRRSRSRTHHHHSRSKSSKRSHKRKKSLSRSKKSVKK
jgi:hypothetical protein